MSDAYESSTGAELGARAVSGVAWTGVSRISQQIIQLAVIAVLAHLLVPADFGLVAMIVVFTGFATLLVDSGLGAAIIQRRSLTSRHLSSAFWSNVALGLLLAGLLCALAPLLARFYGQPRLLKLTLVVSLDFVLTSLTVVQLAVLERAMRFRRIALIENAAILVAGGAAISAAVAGLGVWSLVLLALASTAGEVVLLWLVTDWRPRVLVDRVALRELWGFSGNLAGAVSLNYWIRNADNLLVGRFVGAAALGIYGRAYSLMLAPLTQVTYVVGRVLFPALSRIQNDRARVKQAYVRSVGVTALLTFPIVVGCFVAAKPIVATLLGPKWHGVVPILQILCVPALTQSIGATVGVIYQSQGRTDWQLRWTAASAAITIAAFAIGIHWGIKGVAAAYAIRTVLLVYFNFSIPGRLIEMTFLDVVRATRSPLAAALSMGGIVFALGSALPGTWPQELTLLCELAIGITTYLLIVRAFSVRPYREVVDLLRFSRQREVGTGTLGQIA